MQQLSKQEVAELFRYIERQTAFILKTTAQVHTYRDFLASDAGMVLFNSTCMCLQSIGEAIRQVDDRTAGRLLALYPASPWKQIAGLYHIIAHEYYNIDVELIFDIAHEELPPLLETIHHLLADIDAGLRDEEMKEKKD